MECWQKHIWNSCTQNDLINLALDKPDWETGRRVLENWDKVAKPLDGMGKFEILTAQIGAIMGTDQPDISRKAVIIMCADNGVVEEGVSQCGQEVTAAVARQMAKGSSSIGKMAAAAGAITIPIDIGINQKEKLAGVLDRRIRCGTRNFRKEPAMTEKEAIRAIFTGIEAAGECKRKGFQILATGEMGIGNTTTASAVAAALLNCDVEQVTGRGAGLTDEKLAHKKKVITESIEAYELRNAEPLRILETVGGFDLAGLAGVCIGGGIYHMPVVLDGVITLAAALLAERLVPGTRQYLIPSHKGKEPAAEMLLRELELEAVIEGNMALGEGTGAVMMMALLDLAFCVYHKKTTFSDLEMEPYTRSGIG